jgi:chorismate mutase
MTRSAGVLGRLARLRKAVDAQDRRILANLNDRMRVVRRIGRVKHAVGLPVYSPAREAGLLRVLVKGNRGPLTAADLRSIYRRILFVSRALERRRR